MRNLKREEYRMQNCHNGRNNDYENDISDHGDDDDDDMMMMEAMMMMMMISNLKYKCST